MGKFDGIYIACDLDGTLLDSRTNGISEENIEAINHFMREGGRFGFASGRTVSELREADCLVHSNAPSIACNGTKVFDISSGEGMIIDQAGEDILPFLEYVERAYPNVMIEMVSDDDIYCYRINSSIEQQRSISNSVLHEIPHFSLIPHPWMKIAIWDEPPAIKEFAETVDRSRIPERYNFMYSYTHCCEISTLTADKGVGLLEAKKLLGFVRKTVAIGDNENDILMLKNADISFVPSNAVEAAKRCADVVLDRDCNHGAVAQAIRLLERDII